MSQPTPSIDVLLNLVPDHSSIVLQHLHSHPSLAPLRDAHGYSLLHAAASYNHPDLARALVSEFAVDPNLTDEDGETPLFAVENIEMAKLLLELGTEREHKNDEGFTAGEKIREEGEWEDVAEFLSPGEGGEHAGTNGEVLGNGDERVNGQQQAVAEEGGSRRPPPLPEGIRINVGTMSDADIGGEPDPEFRRRIEELAARGDFEGEEGQRELRRLVEEAIGGISGETEGEGPATRRRRV